MLNTSLNSRFDRDSYKFMERSQDDEKPWESILRQQIREELVKKTVINKTGIIKKTDIKI